MLRICRKVGCDIWLRGLLAKNAQSEYMLLYRVFGETTFKKIRVLLDTCQCCQTYGFIRTNTDF